MPRAGGQSRRDRIIVYILTGGFIIWIALMPLDARRFHWTPRLPLAVELVGDALLALSWLLLFRSVAANTFGWALVRGRSARHRRGLGAGGGPGAGGAPGGAQPRRGGAAHPRAARLRRIPTARA